MKLSRSSRAVTVTVTFVLFEWLLFELIRAPYFPPYDMRTLLGTEKYGMMFLMGMIAASWLLYFLVDGLSPLPTKREGLIFACVFCSLCAVTAAIVFCPPWPVTPLHLLLE